VVKGEEAWLATLQDFSVADADKKNKSNQEIIITNP